MGQFKNQKEVLESLLNGMKIRSYTWDNTEYIYINGEGNVVNSQGKQTLIPNYYNIEIYTPPKKKVTKTLEYYVNVYPADRSSFPYESEEDANDNADKNERIACVKLTGTYVVEE